LAAPALNRPGLRDQAVERSAATWRATMGLQGCSLFLRPTAADARALLDASVLE